MRSLLVPFVLFAAGIAAFSINARLEFVLWDEFLWRPDVIRVAQDALPNLDLGVLAHPTDWQYPPLFFVLEGVVVRLFGEAPVSLRLLSILSSALLAPWAFLIARAGAGSRAGLLAGLYALSLPIAHRYGATFLVDPLQASLVGAALYLFVRAEKDGRSLLPAAALAALAGATKYTSFLLSAALLAALLAERARPGAGERRRSNAELLVFTALLISPLLFLRRGDLALLRAMTFWRSLPFDWKDFLRVVPAPLFILALFAPFPRDRFPRCMRGAYVYFAAALFFFFWRRQQMNWFLPAAVPLAVLAAHATEVLMRGKTRPAAAAVACAILAYGSYGGLQEILAYRESQRAFAEASAYVGERASPEDVVAVDALPFKSRPYARYVPCDVRTDCYRRARFAVLVPWVFENFRMRGFSSSAWGEVHEAEIRRSWTLERRLMAGGEPAVEIYSNPDAPPSPAPSPSAEPPEPGAREDIP